MLTPLQAPCKAGRCHPTARDPRPRLRHLCADQKTLMLSTRAGTSKKHPWRRSGCCAMNGQPANFCQKRELQEGFPVPRYAGSITGCSVPTRVDQRDLRARAESAIGSVWTAGPTALMSRSVSVVQGVRAPRGTSSAGGAWSRRLKELESMAEVAYLRCFHGFDPLIGLPLSSL